MKHDETFDKYAPKPGFVLALKSLNENMEAHSGFIWPESGRVIAPDWKPTDKCGNGLHGFLWGVGDSRLAVLGPDAKWLVLSVEERGIIDLGGKIKFDECEVLFCGDRETAVVIISQFAPKGTAIMFGTATAGYRGTATAGDGGTATAGDSGTATAGDRGTATAGYRGTATAGLYGMIIIEYWNDEKEAWLKKAAFIDGVEFLRGVKYRLNSEHEFEQVNETEA